MRFRETRLRPKLNSRAVIKLLRGAIDGEGRHLGFLTRENTRAIMSEIAGTNRRGSMKILGRGIGVGAPIFCLLISVCLRAQNPVSPTPSDKTDKTTDQSRASGPDSSKSYYHFMLARRYRELAALGNRPDLVERAVSEYKQALEADPESLFLRTELAEFYWRIRRNDDAIREAEAVLKVNPDYEEGHRLLAQIYWRNLGESQPEKIATENMRKAIEHLEALARLSPSDPETYVSLGRLYKISNQSAKAEEAFKKALGREPTSKSALANLAQLFFEQGDYEQAIRTLKKIPDSEFEPSLLNMLALAYGQTHDLPNAVATFEKALAEEPENHDIRGAYAEVLMSNGKTEEARKELEKILKANPDDGTTHLHLAQLDRQEGRFDQARQELERAKTLLPNNLDVPYQQAQLEDLLGNQEKAIQILQGLIKQSERPQGQYTASEANNRAVFLERLGLIYRSQEKFDQAIETFRQVVGLGKSQAARGESLIIETLRLNRRGPEAMNEAEAAVQKYPQDRSLQMLQATLLGERGRVEEATKKLQSLLSNTSADREIYLAMAQVYSQAKRYSEAETAIHKAMSLGAKPADQEYALFMLGSLYERQKRYDQAEQQFTKVLAVNPLNAAAANYLGYMLADRGVRLEESVRYIKKALELEPNNGAYLDSLGWAYFKMNRLDLAEPPLERAARLVSNDPTIHEHLGHLYLQMGKKLRAQEEWERALKEWPGAVTSDFDAEQANRLRKNLDDLKLRMARERATHH